MNTAFAKSCGYTGKSPAMLGAFAAIRAAGIAEARATHFDRKRIVDQMKAEPGMFFNAIRPSLSTAEAIEDARRFIFGWRSLPKWQQHGYRAEKVTSAKQQIVVARYFRRFGRRVWAIEVAA